MAGSAAAAAKQVFSIDGHVVNITRANLKSSNSILFFQQCSDKAVLKVDQVSHFLLYTIFFRFCPNVRQIKILGLRLNSLFTQLLHHCPKH